MCLVVSSHQPGLFLLLRESILPSLGCSTYNMWNPFLFLALHLSHPILIGLAVSGWLGSKLGWAIRFSVLWTWYRNCLLFQSTLTGSLDGLQIWSGYFYATCLTKQRKLVGRSWVGKKQTLKEVSQEDRPFAVWFRSHLRPSSNFLPLSSNLPFPLDSLEELLFPVTKETWLRQEEVVFPSIYRWYNWRGERLTKADL